MLREFMQSQKFSGVLLIFCTLVSITLSNSFFSIEYLNFWHRNLNFVFPEQPFSINLEQVVNEALMAVFFLLVGLEIKRELLSGELSSLGKASLPVAAAMGGMIVPALFYVAFNHSSPTSAGWGIPMATDIAFAIGVLSLLGNRIPDGLKILLTALAVVDDLGAVLVIALFYSAGLSSNYLISAGGVFILLIILNRLNVRSLVVYLFLGLFLWYFIYKSGIHSTISGVLLAAVIPFRKQDGYSPLLVLEHALQKPVNFIIMPLFALVNTCIVMSPGLLSHLSADESLGIGIGLFMGKPVGILLFVGLMLFFKLGQLPDGINRKHILGMGFLGGIGFTMSIFISLLAFDDPAYILNAKLVILVSSLLSGLTGFLVLKRFSHATS